MLGLLLALTAVEGCKKKTPVVNAPPPVQPTAPAPVERPVIAQFEAEPATIERGQSSTLRWSVTGQVTEVSINPGIGRVDQNGNRQVFPGNSTTYTLTATGPGGGPVTMTASVTVNAPQPVPTATVNPPGRNPVDILNSEVKDIYFDYDRSEVREDARAILTRNADVLKQIFTQSPNFAVVVEGHADERGSAEYNLGLSDRRATATKEFLVQLGVPADRLKPVSMGKERPQCTESNESCWGRNRRAHFSAGQ
jgi:peptidoglycan-associated lipoprotein